MDSKYLTETGWKAVVLKSKPDLCITHAPGYLFISDLSNEELVSCP